VDAWPTHGREVFDFDFGQFDFVIDLGGVAERSELKGLWVNSHDPIKAAYNLLQIF